MESIHLEGIVQRDIKPDHFLLGRGSRRREIQIVDFGLAKPFRHPRTLQHVPYSSGIPFVGTTRYCSLNSHAGVDHTRRDDLESIAYVLIYLRRGSLPWQHLQSKSKCLQKKRQVSIETLCSDLPSAFEDFLRYTRGLKFDEEPNYDYLRQLFLDLGNQEGYRVDPIFDWDMPTPPNHDAIASITPCTPMRATQVETPTRMYEDYFHICYYADPPTRLRSHTKAAKQNIALAPRQTAKPMFSPGGSRRHTSTIAVT